MRLPSVKLKKCNSRGRDAVSRYKTRDGYSLKIRFALRARSRRVEIQALALSPTLLLYIRFFCHFFRLFSRSICLRFLAEVSRLGIMTFLLARSSHTGGHCIFITSRVSAVTVTIPDGGGSGGGKSVIKRIISRNRNWNFQTWSFPATGRKLAYFTLRAPRWIYSTPFFLGL